MTSRPLLKALVATLCLSGMLPGSSVAQAAPAFDIVIRGGRLLDGSGNPWIRADVGIRGDRITAVGDLRGATGTRVINAEGLYVAPGFIDTHSHAGGPLATPALASAHALLAQGVTTVFVNPDGGGPVDLAAQRRALQANPLGVNVALMMPHGSVRGAVIGNDDRAPTAEELARMEALVQKGMDAGAFALSSGPFYAPGSFSKTDELVALAKVGAKVGAPYQSHIRDEADYSIGVLAAVEEVITVAREAGTRGVVTHVKALGPNVWGFSSAIVQRIERARAEGVQVFADQYPYEASGTSLASSLVPRWAQAGGTAGFRARLAVAADRARIVKEMNENLARRGGAERLRISRYAPDTTIEGKSLAEIATARKGDPVEVALAIIAKGDPGVTSFNMLDEDIERLMQQPWTMTASDGPLVSPGVGVPHPRGNGTFPRKIHKYVVEDHVVDLAFAVRSMTSLPAAVYNVPDRGVLRAGAMADVVVFDLAKVRDRATYDAPHQMAEGMAFVIVNGKISIDNGAFGASLGGRVLSRP